MIGVDGIWIDGFTLVVDGRIGFMLGSIVLEMVGVDGIWIDGFTLGVAVNGRVRFMLDD